MIGHEIIGLIGGILFAICGVPQVWQCYKQGHARGLSTAFVVILFFGEMLSFLYTCMISATFLEKVPYLLNYGANVLLLLVLFKYIWWPREVQDSVL